MSTCTGYATTHGTRERLTWHDSTRLPGWRLEVWRTGARYTVEEIRPNVSAPVVHALSMRGVPMLSESVARMTFEQRVDMHYECPECGEDLKTAWHACPAND